MIEFSVTLYTFPLHLIYFLLCLCISLVVFTLNLYIQILNRQLKNNKKVYYELHRTMTLPKFLHLSMSKIINTCKTFYSQHIYVTIYFLIYHDYNENQLLINTVFLHYLQNASMTQ